MSTPTGGAWNNDQQGDGQGYQAQSLGQDFGQQQGQQQNGQQQQGQPQQQPGYGQSAYGEQTYGQPAYGEQTYGQPAPEQPPTQHGGFGGQAQQAGQQWATDAGQIASGAGKGIGDLLSDLQFKKSLTEKIAGLTYLLVIVWAVINFISELAYNFGSQDFGGTSVRNMGTFAAIVHSIADLALLVVIVAIVRVVLELAVNVARIAQRNKA